MKNKSGFIATSILYSFFVVFLVLSLFIISSYENGRFLNDTLNENILSNLNDHISSQYITITNSFQTDPLIDKITLNHTTGTYTKFETPQFELKKSSQVTEQTQNRIIYISYKLYSDSIIAEFGNINSGISILNYTENFPNSTEPNHWNSNYNNTYHSFILSKDIEEDKITMSFIVQANEKNSNIEISEIKVIDVTGIKECNENECLNTIKEYLDTKQLPIPGETYQIRKL